MPTHLKTLPVWVYLSLAANGLLLGVLILLLLRGHTVPSVPQANASTTQASSTPRLGARHQLTYEQWVALLRREAEVAAIHQPQHLNIILGDSLSLWFPPDLLPSGRAWLNQGISGETSAGLLSRLQLFEQTEPEAIFIMIGINDLIRGVNDETILDNQERMVRYLKFAHPQAQIVLQSILPHASNRTPWEDRIQEAPPWVARLKATPNSRVRNLNRQLAALADKEGVAYLDLHALFTDAEGNIRPELTTDGLHLSTQGYWVWRSAIQVFSQLKLKQ